MKLASYMLVFGLSFLTIVSCLKKNNKQRQTSTEGSQADPQVDSDSQAGRDSGSSDVVSANVVIDETVVTKLKELGLNEDEALETHCKSNNANLKTVKTELDFAEHRGCDFGQAPQLEKKDQHLQAFVISQKTLTSPNNVILCNLTLQSKPESLLQYDDYLVISLDQHVLVASNSAIVTHLEKAGVFYQWNTDRLRGESLGDINAAPYCVEGLSSCSIPGHEERAKVELSFESRAIANLALELAGRSEIAVNLIVSGDNDDTDCFHTDLTLEAELSYLSLE